MTDQKLIERLRAVIETATSDAYTAASQMNVTREDYAATERDVTEAEAVRDLVVAALEKAYTPTEHAKESDTSTGRVNNGADSSHVTPTDDEVNAVALAYWGPSVTYDRERLRAALAGFRRSEVPEPSAACESCGTAVTADGSGGWNHVRPQRTLHVPFPASEPQGEPSDAQAGFIIHDGESIAHPVGMPCMNCGEPGALRTVVGYVLCDSCVGEFTAWAQKGENR